MLRCTVSKTSKPVSVFLFPPPPPPPKKKKEKENGKKAGLFPQREYSSLFHRWDWIYETLDTALLILFIWPVSVASCKHSSAKWRWSNSTDGLPHKAYSNILLFFSIAKEVASSKFQWCYKSFAIITSRTIQLWDFDQCHTWELTCHFNSEFLWGAATASTCLGQQET